MKIISENLNKNWSAIIDQARILCLTPNSNNLLMWSHYADSHKGIVVQFKKNLSLGKPIKVDYCNGNRLLKDFLYDAMIKIGLKEMGDDFSEEDSVKLTNIFFKVIEQYFFMKKSDWAYENEYRIIYKSDDPKIKKNDDIDVIDIDDDDIECIIFGALVSSEVVSELKLLIKQNFKKAKLKQCVIDGWSLDIKVIDG